MVRHTQIYSSYFAYIMQLCMLLVYIILQKRVFSFRNFCYNTTLAFIFYIGQINEIIDDEQISEMEINVQTSEIEMLCLWHALT